MLDYAQAFLAWVAGHPGWALGLLFVVSLVDALFIIGAFVPASIVLFGAGALVALGSVELWHAAALAAAGALIGDGVSFWLGRRHGERLFASALMQRYPSALANGRALFARHGGKGVMLARFLGPVRAVTPAIAGASGMPAWLFLLADGAAACLWALVYIVPGMVFGASLGLAAEVAGRLATLLIISALAILLLLWATRGLVTLLQRHAERWLGPVLDWSRQHRRLGRFGAALADPAQPETPVLASVAVLLVAMAAGWLAVFGAQDYPFAVDALVYQLFQDLQTPWGTALALALARLGDPVVVGPVAVVTLLALLARRKARAAAHWIAALAFGALLSLSLHALPGLAAPLQYFGSPLQRMPVTRDVLMAVVVYGFIPVLLATQRRPRVGQRAYAVAAVLLGQIVLAKLYLGAEWFSQTLFAVFIGLVWLSALGLGYRRHGAERVYARSFALPVSLMFGIGAAFSWSALPDLQADAAPPQQLEVQREDWLAGGWRALPQRRIDVRGEPGAPLPLQWAGELPAIDAELARDGWAPGVPLSALTALRWLTSEVAVDQLPVLPQVHAGRHPALVLRRMAGDDSQWLIQLWPSEFRLTGGEPLWLGRVTLLEARTRYRLFRYPSERAARLLEALLQARSQTPVNGPDGPIWLLQTASTTVANRYTVDAAPAAAPNATSPRRALTSAP